MVCNIRRQDDLRLSTQGALTVVARYVESVVDSIEQASYHDEKRKEKIKNPKSGK